MPLASALSSPAALFRKLERESYRAYHATSPTHKADHFFNFCVTAASMRDYCLEHLGKIEKNDKRPYYQTWSQVPALVAASEIANSSKHFVLRDKRSGVATTPRTRTFRMKKSHFVSVYAHSDGKLSAVPTEHAEVSVTLSDGTILELHSFTKQVVDYWRAYIFSLGIKVRRQPLAHLSGRGA